MADWTGFRTGPRRSHTRQRGRPLVEIIQDATVKWYQLDGGGWRFGKDNGASPWLGGVMNAVVGGSEYYWFAVNGRNGYAPAMEEAMTQAMAAAIEVLQWTK